MDTVKKQIQKKISIDLNGKKVMATLHPFPLNSIEVGIQRKNIHRKAINQYYNTNIKLDDISDFKELQLCKYKTRWWLFYEPNRMTGSFKSKADAIRWFEDGGR